MAAAASGHPEFYDKQERNLHPFLFVGCWNLQDEPRNAVVATMTQMAAAKGIQNIVLGGDNVYPTKETDDAIDKWKETKEGPKPKKHNIGVFREGIEMLTPPYFVTLALGNHNIENGNVLEAEMAYLPVKNSYYLQEFDDAVLVVFDANITRKDDDKDEKGDKKDLRYTKMLNWLDTCLSYLMTVGKPYYFVTHEPFGSFKKGGMTIWGILKETMKNLVKGGEKGENARVAIESGETPQVLSKLQTLPPVSVLCADTHHYEDGMIRGGENQIRQVIVGSGGASPDDYTKGIPHFSLGGPFIYEMTSAPIKSYGFLSIPEEGVLDFVPVVEWTPKAGGSRRRRTRKRRAHKKMTRRHARR